MASTLTFLDAVNAVLKRVGEIDQATPALTSFTESAIQHNIDVAQDVWREVLTHVLLWGDFPNEIAEGTITLATDTREYSKPADFITFVGNNNSGETIFIHAANNDTLSPYPGGYTKMYADQPDPSQFTGLPQFWANNLVTDNIRVDKTPTSDENGRAYTFLYTKAITLSATTDTFPFPDTAVRQLVPAAAELYRLGFRAGFSSEIFKVSIADALMIIRQSGTDRSYG